MPEYTEIRGNPCRLCGKHPRLTTTVGQLGWQLECCGIGIPFPPAQTVTEALERWNKSNSDNGTD